jgi:hypothetical protein
MTMTQQEALAAVAGQMNDVPETAARTARHEALVTDTNAIIRKAADDMLSLDSSPHSFAALKAQHEPTS